jgi:hypothetical protein
MPLAAKLQHLRDNPDTRAGYRRLVGMFIAWEIFGMVGIMAVWAMATHRQFFLLVLTAVLTAWTLVRVIALWRLRGAPGSPP